MHHMNILFSPVCRFILSFQRGPSNGITMWHVIALSFSQNYIIVSYNWFVYICNKMIMLHCYFCQIFMTSIKKKWNKRGQQLSFVWSRVQPLQWRHNERDGVSDHQSHDCLLNRLFKRRSKKTAKLRVTGLCEWNSPVTGEFHTQRASYAENVSIWWRHHEPSL